MFHIYRKNVPFQIQIAWSCSHSITIWNEIGNKSHFHICCQSSFKRWSWVNLPVHFLMNIPVNKILFATESVVGFHVGHSWYWCGHVHSLGFKGLCGGGCRVLRSPSAKTLLKRSTRVLERNDTIPNKQIKPVICVGINVQFWKNLKEPCGTTLMNIF